MAQPIRKFDVCVNIAKEGAEKAVWRTVGDIAEWQNENETNLSIQMYAMPELKVFVQKPRESVPQNAPLDTHNSEASEIDISDIPWDKK